MLSKNIPCFYSFLNTLQVFIPLSPKAPNIAIVAVVWVQFHIPKFHLSRPFVPAVVQIRVSHLSSLREPMWVWVAPHRITVMFLILGGAAKRNPNHIHLGALQQLLCMRLSNRFSP